MPYTLLSIPGPRVCSSVMLLGLHIASIRLTLSRQTLRVHLQTCLLSYTAPRKHFSFSVDHTDLTSS
jgi:hypothetical protein